MPTVTAVAAGGEIWRRPLHAGHHIRALAPATVDDVSAVVSGSADGVLRAWRQDDGQELWSQSRPAHPEGTTAITVADIGNGTVVVSAGDDGWVRAWRTADGRPAGFPAHRHHGSVNALATIRRHGRTLLVCADGWGQVHTHDLVSGVLERGAVAVDTDDLRCLDMTTLDGQEVIVTGSSSGLVRLIDHGTGLPIGEPLSGNNWEIWQAVAATVHGEPGIGWATGGGSFCFRPQAAGAPLDVKIGSPVTAIAVRDDGIVAVGGALGFAALRLSSDFAKPAPI